MYRISIACDSQEKYENIMKHMERAFEVKKDIRKPYTSKGQTVYYADIEAKGVGGRPQKLTDEQKDEIRQLIGKETISALARKYNVSRATIGSLGKE